MVQVGTVLRVSDKTGVVLGQCIKVLGSTKKKIAKLGDFLLISVKWINVKRFKFLKARLRKRYYLGTLHRALLVRSKKNFCRFPGIFLKFDENAVVIINKKVVPLSNRVYGPILKEFCMRWPSLGCVTRCVV